ncbi:Glutamate/aspartate import permease protein GltJ [Candidatus Entotheonellaceae bacterium PAL068K]
MKYNWDWPIIFCTSETHFLWFFAKDDCGQAYFYWIATGFGWTVLVALAAWVIAFILGSIIGLARTVKQPVARGIASIYVEVFRNIPLLVQMFIWFFVVPEFLPEDAGRWVKRDLPRPEFWTAVVCLGMYHASRTAEQVRAGIQSIPPGQTQAGLAMGLTPLQVYRYVLLPVSYRLIIPPLTSDFMGIFKNSSVALTIGVLELTAQARQITEYTFNGFEAFAAATVLYLLVTLTVVTLMRVVETKVHIPGTLALEDK